MELSNILSIVLTASVSLLSLLISIFSIIFNNRHQRKMKILDIVYEKKYEKYKIFFEHYANYYTNKEYDKSALVQNIMDCLLISNRKTSQQLESLLYHIKNEKIGKILPRIISDCFYNCIQAIKEELNLN